jgi:methylglutaconyl-CoA hydratase
MATKWALVRLSELSIGIGPFVIEPAISRKLGKAAFSQLALNPSEWQTASWAKDHGLYQEHFDDATQLEDYLMRYLNKITAYHALALH